MTQKEPLVLPLKHIQIRRIPNLNLQMPTLHAQRTALLRYRAVEQLAPPRLQTAQHQRVTRIHTGQRTVNQ